MKREDEVKHEEEEDLGTLLQKIPIPENEFDLDQIPIDSAYDFTDGLREIVEDSNLRLEDSQELEGPNHSESIEDSNSSKLFVHSTSSPTATRDRFCVPKRSIKKRGRPKKRCYKSVHIDSNSVNIKSCSHCGTTKTPLWREGPRGAGTLCNACGMRYRTGRLLPEYRPASSPDFKPNVHSNFHRKVMEIRRERNLPPTQ